MCINHTNEKLQNFFLRSVFKACLLYTRPHLLVVPYLLQYTPRYLYCLPRSIAKAEELAYKNDGIAWEPIPYSDNSHIIAVIEGRAKGIFDTLDSVCKAPKATDEMLAKELHETHAKSRVLCRPKASKVSV